MNLIYKKNCFKKSISALIIFSLIAIICFSQGAAPVYSASETSKTNASGETGSTKTADTTGENGSKSDASAETAGSNGTAGSEETAVSDQKASAISKVIELALQRAKEDAGAIYAGVKAAAETEAERIAGIQKEAEAKAAADAAEAAEAAKKAASEKAASEDGNSSGAEGKKIVYFTVDDGPSSLTDQYLDIFEKNGVKATFFVVGNQAEKYPDQIKRMHKGNHLIANHSYSHDYSALYKSQGSLSAELKKWDDTISNILGIDYHTNIFRFPGGSTYSKAKQHTDYVKQLGYKYYDWTCLNGDAELKDKSADSLYKYLVKTYNNRNEEIVLIHDTNSKKTTLAMLDRAIKFFKDNGYEFRTLNQK
jgi:peptidoglycan/xylan/chitin deacetylase (PgdA/CDA1 family)